MTCEHVLALIDVGPFATVASARLDAAWAHAASCPTCGPALATSKALTGGLRRLAHPAAPVHLRATVMARIAAAELPDMARAAAQAGTRPTRPDWSGVAPLAGLVVGLAVVLAVYARTGGLVRLWNSGWSPALPDTTTAAVAVICALGIFVVSLFVPLKWRRT
jgi:hypothetical protein